MIKLSKLNIYIYIYNINNIYIYDINFITSKNSHNDLYVSHAFEDMFDWIKT